MKTIKQAAPTSKTGLVLISIAILLGCKHPVTKVTNLSIEGDFVVTAASIFLTDAVAEKEVLFNTCVSRKFIIKANKLYADTTCVFEGVKDITIVDSFQTTVDSFPVKNSTSFAYFVDGDIESHRRIWVYRASQVFSDGTRDSLFIVKKTMDTIILAQDPYFIKLVRVKQ
ncbi:hypothetical protein A3860_10890 [Niastella vici]|uniref:Uncharacterized protein n=1 Tax=Niastella vici TaxID=1703345 RepID=A0A1V9FFC9_9BACT|nr:hypothetical protein [Niastella vici]OQP57065.1 hypothetical protein A3860_10890 [Niastella vici]